MKEFKNDTGIYPVEYKVLIRLDPIDGKTGSIFLPDDHLTRKQMAQPVATLIACGALAFQDPQGDGEKWPDAPKPGDKIIVGKYDGMPPGADDIENLLRICNDTDVVAVVR
ncbi:hypothetical protein LCGC14_0355350 [marine sediment metagenome]|uniref:10 kDa chaperonin n=1 Tax=marine sediment metagenome TaxID=412755 RepID=A0A0F9T9S3_9ZZZZ